MALVRRPEKGDIQAAREVMDRVDGKVPQGIGGTDELPAVMGIGGAGRRDDYC
jgi:hypothetical protein